jgi:membrane protein implicated in regulation of membrane protease activity
MIISALLIASALMARVNDTVALVGFVLSVALGLFMLWRIFGRRATSRHAILRSSRRARSRPAGRARAG